jgi:ribosomal protein S12 methylthiotransferase
MNALAKPSIALLSLGCSKNLVDSEVMLGLLAEAGYPIVEDIAEADVAIVNTCAFIQAAEEEAIDALLDLAEMKSQGLLDAIVCTGCLPQRYGPDLAAQLPEIDIFVQLGAELRITEAVCAAVTGSRTFFKGADPYALTSALPRWRSAPQWLSYIRIADGCDRPCSFCTIPSIRGKFRSRQPSDVLSEYERLLAEGLKEIVLIAQDTTAYGRELQPAVSLADLLRRMAPISFDGWVRLMYAYPDGLDEDLLQAMAQLPALVHYLDLPLQHASRPVLQRMRRPGDSESYLQLLATARNIMPDLAIRTTFIVGFPGETESDFQQLLDFVTEARFDRLSAFVFSPEEGTPAALLPDQTSIHEAFRRLEELMRVQEAISHQLNEALVGTRMHVLIERRAADSNVWFARSYRDAPEVDCEVKIHLDADAQAPRIGAFYEAQITAAEIHDLVACLLPR